jgi:NADH-quinone oxidoreductase E subunit
MSQPPTPTSFEFSAESREAIRAIAAKYPDGRQASAVLPVLHVAQRQNGGWLSQAAIEATAALLDIPVIRVLEVATFYTMFNLKPVGRYHIQVCTNLPCWLRGSDCVIATCERVLGIRPGETAEDGLFTLSEVECLGACANAPMMQINEHYYEDLDEGSVESILSALRVGHRPKPGSQTGRKGAEPTGGPTALKRGGTSAAKSANRRTGGG